jgi:hypothetical protein
MLMAGSMAKLAVIKLSAVMSCKHRRKAEAKDVCDTPNERLKELWSRR